MVFNEEKLKEKAQIEIKKCRDGDWGHCQRVVQCVKELGKDRDDLYLLITAGYIHDIGWRDVIPPQKLTLDELKKFEPIANANTEPFISDFLGSVGYSDKEIRTVVRIIKAVDSYTSNQPDEAIVVDADCLSKLCIEHIKQKFRRDEWLNMLAFFKAEAPRRIKTEEGKKTYPKLLTSLEQDLNREMNWVNDLIRILGI